MVYHPEEDVHEGHDESRTKGGEQHRQDEFGQQAGVFGSVLERRENGSLTAGKGRRFDEQKRHDGKNGANPCDENGIPIGCAAGGGDILSLTDPGG